jgi:hypothetical protein
MPRGDRTGPMGMGPMTGRAAGYCAGYPVPGFMNPYGGRFGRGMGWGRGFGWGRGTGWGRWGGYAMSYPNYPPAYEPGPYAPPYMPEQELEFLQNQSKLMSDQLNEIQKRISELESESSKKEK